MPSVFHLSLVIFRRQPLARPTTNATTHFYLSSFEFVALGHFSRDSSFPNVSRSKLRGREHHTSSICRTTMTDGISRLDMGIQYTPQINDTGLAIYFQSASRRYNGRLRWRTTLPLVKARQTTTARTRTFHGVFSARQSCYKRDRKYQ